MNEIQDIQNLYNEVREIIASARQNAVRSVDFCRVQMYWNIGQRIIETEQKGKECAEYGSYLLKNLAKRLEPEYGSGFSVRQLELCRQFYRIYPIANTLYSQLNWSQYKLLISISDEDNIVNAKEMLDSLQELNGIIWPASVQFINEKYQRLSYAICFNETLKFRAELL